MLLSQRAIEKIFLFKRNVKTRNNRKCRLHNTIVWQSMYTSTSMLPSITEISIPESIPDSRQDTDLTRSPSFKSPQKRRKSSSGRSGTGKKSAKRKSGNREKRGISAARNQQNGTQGKVKKSERSPKGTQWTELGRNVDVTKSAGPRADQYTPETVSGETTPEEDAIETRPTSTDFYDTDFESDTGSDMENDGLQAYRVGCQVLGVTALPRAISQWSGPTINLNYRNLGPSGAKALTSALMLNPHVHSLELQENRLGGIGGMYVATYMRENVFITHLNLAQNNLGSMGAMAIAEIMQMNRTLQHLDLSDNNFRDSDGDHLARAIEMAERLRSLNLSHNSFSEDGATRIGRAIGRNDSLEKLDFSWNQLRRKGAGGVCAGVKRNTNMQSVNISWNGLGYEGSIGIGEMLRGNDYLRELDISSNRINWEGAVLVSKGLSLNYSLEKLKIGKNPLTMTGCRDILEAINSNPNSKMTFLGLEDVPVNRDILSLMEYLRDRQKMDVAHGGVVDSVDVIGRRKDMKKDPIQLLLDYLTSRGIRPVDLFRSLKQDDKNMVSKDAFLQGLQNIKVPMHQRQIESILDSLDTGDDGMISFNLLMKGVKDQIRVNRVEEKKRMDQEDKFNLERKRLMALTPPNEKRSKSKKSRANQSRDSRTNPDWSDSEWLTEEDSDDVWQESLNLSENLVDSRSVTPVLEKSGYGKSKERQKQTTKEKKCLLPVINNAQLSKSRGQLSLSESNSEKSRKQQKLSILESQKIYQERFQREYKSDSGDLRKSGSEQLQVDSRTKKPQRLLPLPRRSSELPTRGSKSRGSDQGNPTAKSLDSWAETAPPDSSLPSAMFSQSVNLKSKRNVKLQPLEEKGEASKAKAN